MSAPVLGSDDHRQQNVHPVSSSNSTLPSSPSPRPGILSLMRMMQRQKMQQYGLGDDYDQEWDLFCVLCEMLRTIITNKMSCEAPDEVDPFEESYSSLTSDADRVNFIISHPDVSCILKYFAREFCNLRQEFGAAFAKSSEIAASYREQGDRLFQQEEFMQAAHKYSQAIKFSPITGSSDEENRSDDWNGLTRCYADRSACYFSGKEFAAAVSDVDLALAAGLPFDRKPVLYERKLLSLKHLGRDADAEEAFIQMEHAIRTDQANDPANDDDDHAAAAGMKQDLMMSLKGILSQAFSPETAATIRDRERGHKLQQIRDERVMRREEMGESGLTNANSKLRLYESAGRGRFITTVESVRRDDVLIHEPAAVSWLRPSCYQDYCYHCLTQFHHHFLIPCSSCALVAYCSTECRTTSWNEYHSRECRDLPILRHLSKAHMVSRILMMLRRHEITGQDDDGEESEDRRNKRIDLGRGIDKLISHSNDYPFTTSLETCVGACFFAFLLQALAIIHPGEHTVQTTATSLLTYLFQLNVNCLQVVQQDILILDQEEGRGVREWKKKGEETRTRGGICYRIEERTQNPGYGLYLTSSFLNHSCFNTTKSFFDGNTLTFVARNDFDPGQEITFNYGPHYKVSNREERRKYLKDLYFFTCDCKACHEDWAA